MSVSSHKHSRWGTRFLLLGMLLLILSPFGFVAARSFVDLSGPSPAQGRAQVITQGIAELPGDEYVMRIVKRIAPALGKAKVGRRALSIALATDEPILITEVTGEGEALEYTDVARIAPGEAYLTYEGTRQIRASLSGASAEYIGIEFVTPEDAKEVGTGELIYVSQTLATPSGQRDIDLVRNVLAQTDVGNVPNTGGEILVLATDGAIDIIAGQSGPQRLQAGESAIFSSEELEISASEDSAYGVPTNQLASLTNMLQTDDPTAGYVVLVIGPEVPKTGEPTPTNTIEAVDAPSSTPEPSATQEATEEPTDVPATLGSVGITGRLCEAGVTVEEISDTACPVLPQGFDMDLSGRPLAEAFRIDVSWFWTELPLGSYVLTSSSYPDNANSYYVPGFSGSPDTGYMIDLSESVPDVMANVYYLQPVAVSSTAPVTFTFQMCERGDPEPTNCSTPPSNQVDVAPYLMNDAGQTYSTADATNVRNTQYTWTVPAGTYYLYQGGWDYSFVVNGAEYKGGSPFVFTTDGQTEMSTLVQDIWYVIL